MRYPEFLRPGGTIGFIAPSFGCTTEPYVSCFEAALRRFRDMGYRTITGPNCYLAEGVGKSNTPEACGAEINEFFIDRAGGPAGVYNGKDGSVDVIISCGGGETMCENLPYVDFKGIAAARPRWFMGYSDNTNLTFTLPVLCDTAAIYGPNAPSFGMGNLHTSLDDAFRLLTGEKLAFSGYDAWEKDSLKTPDNPLAEYNLTEPSITRVFCEKDGQYEMLSGGNISFSGRLIGGCLDCLSVICGTRFDKMSDFHERYKDEGFVWFLEACDLGAMGIRRALWQLRESGWFRGVSGFIFGRPLMLALGDDPEGLQEAVLAPLRGLGVPIVLDADIGHTAPSIPLISGAYAEVSFCVEGNEGAEAEGCAEGAAAGSSNDGAAAGAGGAGRLGCGCAEAAAEVVASGGRLTVRHMLI